MSRLLVQISHLYKSFGPLSLFEDISLSVNEGDIFALIGENGSGKTTLLELLREECKNSKIGFLPQEVPPSPLVVKAYLEEGRLTELERKMASALEHPEGMAEWSCLHEEYERLGGYNRLPIEKILTGLKLNLNILEKPMSELSSGGRVRVALAKSLLEAPDLLLLDEPTNHLDPEMQQWLQEMLRNREGATIIVSHDRRFLNQTCNRLLEIRNKKITCYGGNYDFYLSERERQIEREMKAYEVQQEERAQLKQKIKAITFSKKQATPPKDRNIMSYDARGENHQKSLQRNLSVLKEKLREIEENPLQNPTPKTILGLKFTPSPLASSIAIELVQVTKAFGEKPLFSNLSRTLAKGDRIVLTGPNGSGKTTLLRCILGKEPLDSGQIKIAPTAKIAYLDQEVDQIPLDQTPLQYFEIPEETLRRELHQTAIGGAELLHRPFGTMSVGQRKRLMLLSLILKKPNVLLLDEPTNHLDLLTLEAFETALLDFEGAILAISHDATFIEKIATQKMILLIN